MSRTLGDGFQGRESPSYKLYYLVFNWQNRNEKMRWKRMECYATPLGGRGRLFFAAHFEPDLNLHTARKVCKPELASSA